MPYRKSRKRVAFLDPLPEPISDPVPQASPPSDRSVGRRWKDRRNLVIVVAHAAGVSQRFLADVFDLPHSRIAAIVKEYRTKYGPSKPWT